MQFPLLLTAVLARYLRSPIVRHEGPHRLFAGAVTDRTGGAARPGAGFSGRGGTQGVEALSQE